MMIKRLRVGLLVLLLQNLALFAGGNQITSYMAFGEFDPDPDYAQVEKVVASRSASGTWTFTVTIFHRDSREDYANRFLVINPETGEVLAERILTHPHINEMPVTRSKSGILIPEHLESVIVRAGCTAHPMNGRAVVVPLMQL